MTKESLRAFIIGFVLAISIFAVVKLILDENWTELLTTVLGVAGFILTWEMTKPKEDA